MTFSGSAYIIHIDPASTTMDVTDGFSGFGRYTDQSLEGMTRDPSPVNSSINVTATLSDADRILATVQFSAPVTGAITWDEWGIHPKSNTATGSAVGVMTIAQGVDPSLIPPWLTSMTATVKSYASGGGFHPPTSDSSLTITADTASVPEPSSMLMFLAAAGLIGYRHLRRAGTPPIGIEGCANTALPDVNSLAGASSL
jgi:hypothetical protein